MSLHPYDRVSFLIEPGGPSQCFNSDVVLFDLLGGTLEILLANVGENLREIRRAVENTRSEKRLVLPFFLLELRGLVHQ